MTIQATELAQYCFVPQPHLATSMGRAYPRRKGGWRGGGGGRGKSCELHLPPYESYDMIVSWALKFWSVLCQSRTLWFLGVCRANSVCSIGWVHVNYQSRQKANALILGGCLTSSKVSPRAKTCCHLWAENSLTQMAFQAYVSGDSQ
jgi:hypothetical protein